MFCLNVFYSYSACNLTPLQLRESNTDSMTNQNQKSNITALKFENGKVLIFFGCGTSTLNLNVKKGTNVQIFDSICVYISFKILFDFLVCDEMNSMSGDE